MNKNYEIARLVTKSNITDEAIKKEISSFTGEERDAFCIQLDIELKEAAENVAPAEQEQAMFDVLAAVSNGKGISTTAAWVTYLDWLDVDYEVK